MNDDLEAAVSNKKACEQNKEQAEILTLVQDIILKMLWQSCPSGSS